MGQVRCYAFRFVSILLASLAFPFSPAGRTAYDQPERETGHVVIASQSLPPLIAEYTGVIAQLSQAG